MIASKYISKPNQATAASVQSRLDLTCNRLHVSKWESCAFEMIQGFNPLHPGGVYTVTIVLWYNYSKERGTLILDVAYSISKFQLFLELVE